MSAKARRQSMRLASSASSKTEQENSGMSTDEEIEYVPQKKAPATQDRRRSIRTRTPKKYDEYIVENKKNKYRSKKKSESSDDVAGDSDDDDGQQLEELEKPTTLFMENKDVAGGDIFGFRTPKKRNGMALLAANTPKTPKTPKLSSALEAMALKTPKNRGRTVQADTTKTPHNERARMRKGISKAIREEGTSDEDFSADEDSDYKGDEQSESDSEAGSSDASNDNESDEENSRGPRKNLAKNLKTVKKAEQPAASVVSARSARLQRRGNRAEECVPLSDNYFSAQSSKVKTSNRTLGNLKNSRLQCDELFTLLKSIQLSDEHAIKIRELNQDHELLFDKWMLMLSKGFNVILYGLGSKQLLINRFCQLKLAKIPLIIVNGFFPTLTVKDILTTIFNEIINVKTTARNNHELVDVIAATFRSSPDTHFFLIIHNIDGPMLRKTKDQHILSRLAKIPNIHLVCSIDHINAPMMWDQTCMSNFNFLWYDCTTMLPYTNETAFETSGYMQQSGELGLAAMCNVFRSLTTNAKSIYMLLARNQLDHNKDPTYQGMSFKDLYRACREGFYVNSDTVLRTQLTEFYDHNMCKNKRSVDGTEYLSIPIDKNILGQFVEQQSN